jgi:pre-mRNA-splicing factor ATP-dependent RNA helicase DHX16
MEARPRFVVYSELVLTSKEYMRNVFEIDGQWLSDIGPMLYKQSDIEKLGLEKKMPKGQGKVGIDGR